MKISRRLQLYLSAIAIVFGSCTKGTLKTKSYRLPDKATLQLMNVFRVSEPANGAFFSQIRKIHILENGHLVVQNYPDHQLYELSADGNLIDVIGREGRGPGEFIETFNSYLTANDSLHVFDVNHSRHQVLVKNREGKWIPVREPRFKYIFQRGLRAQIPASVVPGPDGSYYGLFLLEPTGYNSSAKVALRATDTLSFRYEYVARINSNVEQMGKSSRLRPVQDEAIQRIVKQGSMATVMRSQFWRAFYRYNPVKDEVLYITNTSNKIIGIDSTGNEYVKGRLPFERITLSRQEIKQAVNLNKLPTRFSKMGQIVRKKLLEYEPLYRNVVLVKDRLWVHLTRLDKSKPNWIITTLKGKVLNSFCGPNDISVVTISGRRMYGQVRDSSGVTYLAGYKLVTPED